MGSKRRGVLLGLFIILVSVATLIVLRSYIFHRIKTTLHEKFQALNKSGYQVHYDSIDIDWKRNIIKITNLNIKKNAYDTTCVYPEFISVSEVTAKGANLTNLIFRRRLGFQSLQLISPHFVFRKNSQFFPDSVKRGKKPFTITAESINLHAARVDYLDSASCKSFTEFTSNIQVSAMTINLHPDKGPHVSMDMIKFDSTQVVLPQAFYTLVAKETKIDFTNGLVDLDTLQIIPHYDKLTFGRKKGHEADRIEGTIPFINLSGFSLLYQDTVAVKASSANIQMFIKVFRDKRLALKGSFKPLPVQFLRQLPFGLRIDSLEITKSFVEYEEIAEKADTPGKVFFDDLHAVIRHINNDNKLNDGKTIMHATATVMGQGNLRVRSEFPWASTKKCMIEGSLEEMPIPKVNSMLESVANMKAESGKLESLTFKFAYNSIRSDGTLELNYNNLKLISYKDDDKLKKKEDRKHKGKRKKEPEKKNFLKTFILNAFVVKKNMDEKMPEGKRTGTILFYRDINRSVFNYWWKSLLSGLRDAFNLDKYNKKENKKNIKKRKRK